MWAWIALFGQTLFLKTNSALRGASSWKHSLCWELTCDARCSCCELRYFDCCEQWWECVHLPNCAAMKNRSPVSAWQWTAWTGSRTVWMRAEWHCVESLCKGIVSPECTDKALLCGVVADSPTVTKHCQRFCVRNTVCSLLLIFSCVGKWDTCWLRMCQQFTVEYFPFIFRFPLCPAENCCWPLAAACWIGAQSSRFIRPKIQQTCRIVFMACKPCPLLLSKQRSWG